MKPLMRVYPFFDKQNVTSLVTPTGGSLGGNLVTSAAGQSLGCLQFLIQTEEVMLDLELVREYSDLQHLQLTQLTQNQNHLHRQHILQLVS